MNNYSLDACNMVYSGELISYLDPQPETIHISDIVHSLARSNRFCGHFKPRQYSTAQHSVTVCYKCSPRAKRLGIMHDTAEFVIGDIPTPLKVLLGDRIRLIEYNILKVISDRFKFRDEFDNKELWDEVHYHDKMVMAIEVRDLRPKGWIPENMMPKASYGKIEEVWDVERSEQTFNEYFDMLFPNMRL